MRAILNFGAIVLIAAGASPVAAAPRAPVRAGCPADAVSRAQSAVIRGMTRHYTICAGTLPIRDSAGTVRASIFYTAYLLDGVARARPLSFVWNGGPGADSRLLQFHALAPRTLQNGVLVDNADSALSASDLVFVDPVGTGFSRAKTLADGAAFYRTTGDIGATAQFVRNFRSAYHRSGAPTYLVGESFGTWRAAGVAEALIDAGEPLAGIALISGGIPLGDAEDRSLMRALSLPNRTATALALGKLAPDVQAHPQAALAEAEHWARTVYRGALADPAALSATARAEVVARLARYQGLSPATIDAKTLWVSPRQFRTGLIPAEPRDIFDMRKPVAHLDTAADDKVVLAFYRETLGYRDGRYAGIEEKGPDVGGRWEYDQTPVTPESLARAMAGEGPPSASQPWTLRAMQKAPRLRAWVAAGRYDSLNSCPGNAATVAGLPRSVATRFTLRCYAGGHMMYEDAAVKTRFGRDLADFLAR
ncbi:peptidase S10 [Sphingomonas panacis]|uniref:Peptidase S10 n=1 Tax=Sphingomonas panacis TaxID=1560345 RepID=A0A1B3Z5G8_9SPHN|nr:peptidase S10 [Sphingomonas panacis]AOH82668.1 peptidase S10 [Sphingomonas panacis]